MKIERRKSRNDMVRILIEDGLHLREEQHKERRTEVG
jgi:hypothetical protein